MSGIKKKRKKKGDDIFPSQSEMMDASVMCKMNQVVREEIEREADKREREGEQDGRREVR